MNNKTAQDAFLRVLDARFGALAYEPTDEYLLALQQQLLNFAHDVELELKRRIQKAEDDTCFATLESESE